MLPSNAEWFEPYPTCVSCGKPATGTLHSDQNTTLGDYCQRCADKAIKRAYERRQLIAETAGE